MPYKIEKVRNRDCYKVVTSAGPHKGRIHSVCTSKDKAEKQVRLLNAVKHGWKPSN